MRHTDVLGPKHHRSVGLEGVVRGIGEGHGDARAYEEARDSVVVVRDFDPCKLAAIGGPLGGVLDSFPKVSGDPESLTGVVHQEHQTSSVVTAGIPLGAMLPPRFWAKVDRSGDCWIWTGALQSKGYGSFRLNGRTRLAHRLAYESGHGPIAPGLQVDHLCRVRRCVNPGHLEPVSSGLNNRREHLANRRLSGATRCPRKHRLAGHNVVIRDRGPCRRTRECRTCRDEARQLRYEATGT